MSVFSSLIPFWVFLSFTSFLWRKEQKSHLGTVGYHIGLHPMHSGYFLSTLLTQLFLFWSYKQYVACKLLLDQQDYELC